MKKKIVMMLVTAMTASMLFGCSGKPATTENGAKEEAGAATKTEGNVKAGLAVMTSLSGESATAEADGTISADVTVVAVTVDKAGVIQSCVIDGVQANAAFGTDGQVLSAPADVKSKNELGDAYGMRGQSSIGKEWNEQASAMAEYAVGKTVEELKNGAIDENGKAKDADLAASATIYLGGFVNGIEAAVNNAQNSSVK